MRILFVYSYPHTFVMKDLEILSSKHEVVAVRFRREFAGLARIVRHISKVDVIFSWFASFHALVPVMLGRLLKKPSAVVIGGYDVAKVPEIDYGFGLGGIRKRIAQTVCTNTTVLIAQSNAASQEARENLGVTNRIEVVHHGFTIPAVEASLWGSKEDLAITVGYVARTNLKRKGLEPFVRSAGLLPSVPFVLIGECLDDAISYLKDLASPNVTFMQQAAITPYMKRAKVYVQASAHEGFGASVAEAMLYGCVPVVTRVGSLPEVVGDTGVYAESQDPTAVANAVMGALADDGTLAKRARDRISCEFPLERRSQQLLTIIGNLIK